MLPFQIMSSVSRKSTRSLTYHQIYHEWHNQILLEYHRDLDPLKSSKLYAESATNLNLICYNKKPFHIGFATNLGSDMRSAYTIEELFINSNFKTNAQGMELFCIVGKVVAAAFPLSYSITGRDPKITIASSDTFRKTCIENFVVAFKCHFYHLFPKFFLSDKDSGQLTAISFLYGILPTICLWLVQRAVSSKCIELRKQNHITLEQTEQKSLDIIRKEYNDCVFPLGLSRKDQKGDKNAIFPGASWRSRNLPPF